MVNSVLGVQEDQRLEEVVPLTEEHEDPQGGHRRLQQRQDDRGEGAEPARTVDRRCLLQLHRDAPDVLAHQEHTERVEQRRRHDDRQVGVDPLQPSEDEVQRDDGQLHRHHHRGQEHREQRVVPREPDPGERVRRHRAGQQREDRDQGRDVEAVEVGRAERRTLPRRTEPVQRPVVGQQDRRTHEDLVQRLEGREHHPQERDEHEDGEDDEDEVEGDLGGLEARAPAARAPC